MPLPGAAPQPAVLASPSESLFAHALCINVPCSSASGAETGLLGNPTPGAGNFLLSKFVRGVYILGVVRHGLA
jgi:hypothetical protein